MIAGDVLSMSVNDSIVFMKPTTMSRLNAESIILEESQHFLCPPKIKTVDLKDWENDSSESWEVTKMSNSLSSIFEMIEEEKEFKSRISSYP